MIAAISHFKLRTIRNGFLHGQRDRARNSSVGTCRGNRPNCGLTLVELLVVVTIMVILMGVVLPLAQPAVRGREVREAARQVSAYLASAQANAVATGRPVGVEFVAQGGRCVRLQKVRVPPPYSGENLNSIVVLGGTSGAVPMTFPIDSIAVSHLVPLEDPFFRIRFEKRGRLYDAYRDGTSFFVDLSSGPPVPQAYTTQGARFTLLRPPTRTFATPLDLPNGAYIDLNASGFLSPANEHVTLTDSPRIMFRPNGELDRFFGQGVTWPLPPATSQPINGPLLLPHGFQLLIASTRRLEQIYANWPHPTAANLWPEANSVWVSMNAAGKLATTPNLGFDRQSIPFSADPQLFAVALQQARERALATADSGEF